MRTSFRPPRAPADQAALVPDRTIWPRAPAGRNEQCCRTSSSQVVGLWRQLRLDPALTPRPHPAPAQAHQPPDDLDSPLTRLRRPATQPDGASSRPEACRWRPLPSGPGRGLCQGPPKAGDGRAARARVRDGRRCVNSTWGMRVGGAHRRRIGRRPWVLVRGPARAPAA